MWKGTIDSLKPNPASESTMPTISANEPNGTAGSPVPIIWIMGGAAPSTPTTCTLPVAP